MSSYESYPIACRCEVIPLPILSVTGDIIQKKLRQLGSPESLPKPT
jgi:hypothetical protein